MPLISLTTHDFRSLSRDTFFFHPRFNILYGSNGSGKTSVIEAIYLALNARSFRTSDLGVIALNETNHWIIRAEMAPSLEIKMHKTSVGMKVWMNDVRCTKRSELVTHTPSQLIYSDLFEIMDAGPNIRREILDWGMFHVEHAYHETWNHLRRVLKHRNKLLKSHVSRREMIPWDKQFAELSETIHEFRQIYCQRWFEIFDGLLPRLTNSECFLKYYKGWDKEEKGVSLLALLEDHFESDQFKQYTQWGAHQADFLFMSKETKSKHYLSRGQQKMVLIALKLSQAALLNQNSIYLIDDLISELDETHLGHFFSVLDEIKGQFFFTALYPSEFVSRAFLEQSCFFYMNQGQFILNPSN